jgi:prepilin-type N-terminal cleavage/methylation domain-containing protein
MPIQRLNKTADTAKGRGFFKICGLTLVEMLIVSIILGAISLAINSALNSGVKIWRKINQELPQEDLNIFFDKFTAELHNSLTYINYPGFKFIGREQELEFATLATSLRFPARLPAQVAYLYDGQANTLSRKLKDYSDVYNDKEGVVFPVLKDVLSFKFSYYFLDAQSKDYRWQREWDKDELPRAVRLDLEIKDGEKIKQFTRTVSIPVSN